ncbi:polypeptide N-acetylgalactosaminyltransferase 10-like [Archocentrus centrarchus]|uniref:polypeptide N-acetylgalactosaminyltransferase 10-like n=1 Tax=Archocentrus centrarchus TaxID=63155 RepID=UPI0011E9BB76|nr:polypeptide N-acetylgalactosaminyltransferase 10-like [Archocentrus centrarchus]
MDPADTRGPPEQEEKILELKDLARKIIHATNEHNRLMHPPPQALPRSQDPPSSILLTSPTLSSSLSPFRAQPAAYPDLSWLPADVEIVDSPLLVDILDAENRASHSNRKRRKQRTRHRHAPPPVALAPWLNQLRKVTQVGLDGVRRIDWHDYEAMKRDAARIGNGEQGKPFPLTENDRVDQAYRENGFNIYVSNRISLNRSLPDIRHENCRQKLYAEKLPNTSIIIPFHNEGWSSLLRTVHSVLNRSPPQLITEIILVDDFSDKGTVRASQNCQSL